MNKQKPVMKTSTIELPGGFILQHQEPDEENYYTEQMMDEAIKEISEPYIKEERQRVIEEVEIICEEVRNECRESDDEWDKGDESRRIVSRLNKLKELNE